MLKRIVALFFSFLLLFTVIDCDLVAAADLYDSTDAVDSLIDSMPSDNWPSFPDITSNGAILMEYNTGTILYAKNITQKMYPASTTKILTALLALENLKLDDTITFSSEAVKLPANSSNIGIRAGEQLSVRDCLYALLLPSANEAANALAEAVSGSVEEFAKLMNEKAKELGAVNSNFVNANGLHDDNHYTCPYDLALILKACTANKEFVEIASSTSYTIPATNKVNQTRPIAMLHKMINRYAKYYDSSVICGKTGSTPEAGRTLVTCAQKNGMKLLCVVMGTEEPNQYLETKTLFDYGFNNFSLVNTNTSNTEYNTELKSDVQSPLGIKGRSIPVTKLDSSSYVVLPNTLKIDDLDIVLSSMNETTDGKNLFALAKYEYKGYPLGEVSLITEDYSDTSTTSFKKSDFVSINKLLESNENMSNGIITINIWNIVIGIVVMAIIAYSVYFYVKRRSVNNNENSK